MKKRSHLTLFAVLAASIGFGSVALAQPRPLPPGERPLPPGERVVVRPGERPPPGVVVVGQGAYAARLQRVYDERAAMRAQQRHDVRAWEAGRAAREMEYRRDLTGVWGYPFLSRPECRAELEIHAERLARLNRIIDLAEDQHSEALLEHARAVRNREIARDARVLGDLRVRLGIQ
jgi:hypothetical protein